VPAGGSRSSLQAAKTVTIPSSTSALKLPQLIRPQAAQLQSTPRSSRERQRHDAIDIAEDSHATPEQLPHNGTVITLEGGGPDHATSHSRSTASPDTNLSKPVSTFKFLCDRKNVPLTIIRRTLATLPTVRPTLATTHSRAALGTHPSPCAARLLAARQQFVLTDPAAVDLASKATEISAHPALAAMQIRCAPRNTMNVTSRLIRKRRHGFLSRIRTKKGRKLLLARRQKGRLRLAAR
jgi:large subunit ribosomal protein L34